MTVRPPPPSPARCGTRRTTCWPRWAGTIDILLRSAAAPTATSRGPSACATATRRLETLFKSYLVARRAAGDRGRGHRRAAVLTLLQPCWCCCWGPGAAMEVVATDGLPALAASPAALQAEILRLARDAAALAPEGAVLRLTLDPARGGALLTARRCRTALRRRRSSCRRRSRRGLGLIRHERSSRAERPTGAAERAAKPSRPEVSASRQRRAFGTTRPSCLQHDAPRACLQHDAPRACLQHDAPRVGKKGDQRSAAGIARQAGRPSAAQVRMPKIA